MSIHKLRMSLSRSSDILLKGIDNRYIDLYIHEKKYIWIIVFAVVWENDNGAVKTP